MWFQNTAIYGVSNRCNCQILRGIDKGSSAVVGCAHRTTSLQNGQSLPIGEVRYKYCRITFVCRQFLLPWVNSTNPKDSLIDEDIGDIE